jgi:nicotinamidase/pyrazinamidase
LKTLLIVDMQNDFMPGGPLGVASADQLVPLVNALIPKFSLILATQDWHPPDHVSFARNHPGKKPGDIIEVAGVSQILWRAHCVQHSKGAELVSGLNRNNIHKIFYKGTDRLIDSYSAFFDNAHQKSTGLEDYLKSRRITDFYICGVATDYCVLYSVIDALDLGLSVHVLTDVCRGIDLFPGDVDAAFASMKTKGAKLISSSSIP